jgi:cell division protein FtsB
MDTFVILVFTVVAVLFAGLGIVATMGSDEPSFVSSPVWIAAVALYFALKPGLLVRSRIGDSEQVNQERRWYAQLRPTGLELMIASIIVIASLFFHGWHAHVSAREIQQAKEQATQAINNLNQEKQTRETEIRELRQQSEAKADSLQQQIRLLQLSPSKAK